MMTVLYPNLCYNEVCYKGATLYVLINLENRAFIHKWREVIKFNNSSLCFISWPGVKLQVSLWNGMLSVHRFVPFYAVQRFQFLVSGRKL